MIQSPKCPANSSRVIMIAADWIENIQKKCESLGGFRKDVNTRHLLAEEISGDVGPAIESAFGRRLENVRNSLTT